MNTLEVGKTYEVRNDQGLTFEIIGSWQEYFFGVEDSSEPDRVVLFQQDGSTVGDDPEFRLNVGGNILSDWSIHPEFAGTLINEEGFTLAVTAPDEVSAPTTSEMEDLLEALNDGIYR